MTTAVNTQHLKLLSSRALQGYFTLHRLLTIEPRTVKLRIVEVGNGSYYLSLYRMFFLGILFSSIKGGLISLYVDFKSGKSRRYLF